MEDLDPRQLVLADSLEGAILGDGSRGRKPHRLPANWPDAYPLEGAVDEWRLVADLVAVFNVAPLKTTGYAVGMWIGLTARNDEGDEPFLRNAVAGETYSSPRAGTKFVTTTAPDGRVDTAVGLVSYSVDHHRSRTIRLHVQLAVDSTGQISSPSVTFNGVGGLESPMT